MVDFNVNGKTAVITGGTRGLGLHCAEAFVLNGADCVVITSRKAKACEESKALLEKLAKDNGKDCKIVAIPSDLSVEEDCIKFFEATKKEVKKVDILIANAGATWGAQLEDHPISAMHKVLSLNIVGVFNCIKLFAPMLEEAGTHEDPARIVIMSSVVSLINVDQAGVYGYAASKAGVSHLGKNLAVQLGPRNITVNSLAPGFFPSKMSDGLIAAAGDIMIESNPRKRLGTKEDMQSAILFLCSKQANYINGIVLPLDGGAYLNGGGAKL
ncbi:D-arabinitol 2-dehydrogenase [ribulose-forming] [[Candida] jaroonii]|uniref:D-arabinitol 2-dehydrogenase [ribulose-forming] n=1 Tax=[Candida] jaroonii TaxID=467808 RepID=A0ACA9Y6E7_9ASCO|nr:D-arabinitol 2-dehydrogenase [ribulose-forming] [[Candida] jaroonii]